MKFFSLLLAILFCSGLVCTAFAQEQLSLSNAERLYQTGSELVAHANYGAARKIFSEFLQESASNDPRRAEAEYYIAFSALSLNHTDGEKLISDFIEHYPSSPKSSTAYFDLGNFFYDNKNYSKAIQYYKKLDFPALLQDQQNQAHFNWGYSLFNLRRLDEALEQFNFVKGISSTYAPASNYYAGFIEYSNGSYAEALKDLTKAEANPAYASVVPYLIANVYYRQKRYDDLLKYASEAIKRKDVQNTAELSMLIAEAHYFKRDYKSAAAAYEEYLKENPSKAESPLLFRAGFANYSLDNADKAIAYLGKSAASKDSTSFYASYYLGILYLKQSEKALAINAFDVARKFTADPTLAEEAGFQYGKVLYDAGRSEQAIDEFERFLASFPLSAHAGEAKEILAQAYVNGNNYHKAVEYIEALPSRSAVVDLAYQKATYLKGAELFNKNDYREAVVNFEKSLKSPRDPQYTTLASFWAGEAYSVGRRYEQAIPHYQRILENPRATEADLLLKTRYGLGYAYYNMESYDKALGHFREFVSKGTRTSPNYTDGLIRLGDCYYVAKQYEEALTAYNRARNIGSPDNDYVLLQTGVISGIQRKYSESRNHLTALIESYPKSQYRDEALFQRAQFEIEQGNAAAAIEGLSRLIRESTGSPFLPYAYMRRAASYYNLKQYERTVTDYAAVLKQFPTHAVAQEVLLPMQEALTAAGRSAEFESYLAAYKSANPDNKGLESIEFETGKNLFFDQQYAKTVTSLTNFIKNYPQSARASEANYYIAESHYRLKDFTTALPIYLHLTHEQGFAFASRVVNRISEIQFSQGRYEDAIRNFRRLEKVASNKREQYSAWDGLMQSFYFLGQYDSADMYARVILEKGGVNASSQNKASLFLGKTALARGDYETAKDEFLNTLNAAQDEYGAEAKFLLGQVFYLEKDYHQSYETLMSLTNDFASYDEWVGKAFLLIADNFIAQEDFFQAKATLQSLIDGFPLEHIKDQARIKMKEAEDAQLAKEQAASDTIQNKPEDQ